MLDIRYFLLLRQRLLLKFCDFLLFNKGLLLQSKRFIN